MEETLKKCFTRNICKGKFNKKEICFKFPFWATKNLYVLLQKSLSMLQEKIRSHFTIFSYPCIIQISLNKPENPFQTMTSQIKLLKFPNFPKLLNFTEIVKYCKIWPNWQIDQISQIWQNWFNIHEIIN